MEVIDDRGGAADKIKNSKTWQKIKKIKNVQLIAAVFIIAVALLIYSSVTSRIRSDNTNVNSGVSASMNDEEQKLASILSGIEGAGRVETLITRQNGEIVGVLVISEGASDITVLLRLLEATTTALGVNKQIVDIYRMK